MVRNGAPGRMKLVTFISLKSLENFELKRWITQTCRLRMNAKNNFHFQKTHRSGLSNPCFVNRNIKSFIRKITNLYPLFIHKFSAKSGKIGVLVGNHRFRCQEMNEAGFRSYFRKFAPEFELIGSISTFETRSIVEEVTEKTTQPTSRSEWSLYFWRRHIGCIVRTAFKRQGRNDRLRWLWADGIDAGRVARRHALNGDCPSLTKTGRYNHCRND